MYLPGNPQLLCPDSSTAAPLFKEPTQARKVLQSLPLAKNILPNLLQFTSTALFFGQGHPTLGFYTLSSHLSEALTCAN